MPRDVCFPYHAFFVSDPTKYLNAIILSQETIPCHVERQLNYRYICLTGIDIM